VSNEIVLSCMMGYTLKAIGGNLIAEKKKTQEVFPISKIQSFTLKEPTKMTNGTITFRTAQAPTAGIRLGFGAIALDAEKTFVFDSYYVEQARSLRDYVLSYEEGGQKAKSGMVVSVVDEIRGLKQLLDEGILTQEEFDAKKRQLLGI